VVLDLAEKMGISLPFSSVAGVNDYRLEKTGITFSELKAAEIITFPIEFEKFKRKGFNTPSGKVELYASTLKKLGQDPLPDFREPPQSPFSSPRVFSDYPLVAAQYRVREYEHSEGRQIDSLRRRMQEPLCEIHPETAQKYGITNGGWLCLETPGFDEGITLKALYVTQLYPQVVGIPVGWWYPEKEGKGPFISNVNAVVSDEPPYDPISGQYQMRANLCRVRPLQTGIHPRGA
jgi:anaerobic selenocysteine-containing dehydrogenase